MKDNKDIFDLFRDNEHKLNERPSDLTWQRLESRLDNRPGRRRRARPGVRNWLSMAGVLLMLVTIISLLSLFFQKKPKNMASSEMAPRPQFVLEEIGEYNDQQTPNYNISSYKKQLSRLNTNPILEGDPSKELRVQKKVFVALRNRSNNINNNKSTNLVTEDAPIKNPIALTGTKRDKLKSEGKEYRIKEDIALNTKPAMPQAPSATEVVPDSENTANDETTESTKEISIASTITAGGSKEEEINDVDQMGPVSQISLDQFQWILGKWEAPLGNSKESFAKSKKVEESNKAKNSVSVLERSVEEWKQVNPFAIKGNGYLLINDDTTYTESMYLEHIDNEIFFTVAMGNNNQVRKYLLKSYSKNEFIFENENLTFPNQVVLMPDQSNNSFITLFQNNSPTQLNPEQQEFFQKRNQISTEQIKRVMNRVNK